MMPEWHQLDSSSTMSEQQESAKKKTLKSSSRSFWFSTGLQLVLVYSFLCNPQCNQFAKIIMQRSPVPKVMKLFSYSTKLSMKFQLHIKTKILKSKDTSCFKTHISCINVVFILLINVQNANNCWHLNIYEQDQFHAQLS